MNSTINTPEKLSQTLKELLLAEVEERLKQGQTVTIMVRGFSMRPLMNNLRDRAVLVPPTEQLSCGQVVAFRYHGRILLHRIIKIDGQKLIIKGDGVPFHREIATPGDVIAVLKKVVRENGEEISCDSPKWEKMSRRWAAVPPAIQFVLLKMLRLREILLKR